MRRLTRSSRAITAADWGSALSEKVCQKENKDKDERQMLIAPEITMIKNQNHLPVQAHNPKLKSMINRTVIGPASLEFET